MLWTNSCCPWTQIAVTGWNNWAIVCIQHSVAAVINCLSNVENIDDIIEEALTNKNNVSVDSFMNFLGSLNSAHIVAWTKVHKKYLSKRQKSILIWHQNTTMPKREKALKNCPNMFLFSYKHFNNILEDYSVLWTILWMSALWQCFFFIHKN